MLGGRLRRLRQERRLSQVQMAGQLGISPSYLNLLEHNQRPVTVPVLLKLAQRFAVDLQQFSTDEDERLVADLMEAFADPIFDGQAIKAMELKELVGASPNLGRALLALYRAYRGGRAASRPPADPADPAGDELVETPAGMPSEEVTDFIQQRQNHFPELEAAAESLWQDHGLARDNLNHGLAELLARRFAVDVSVLPEAAMKGALREYNPLSRRLALSEMLPPSGRAFQLAHQIALMGWRPQIDRLTSGCKFTTVEADMLARVALANYFAGAVLMPYDRLLEAARATRYDVAVLQQRFAVSFEQLCHRLTTLRRPGAEGVPFHLVRVDVAGNISKRFSGSGIRIARFGAACPRWNVYDAFATPGLIRVQLSRMPDGSSFFCLARTVDPIGRAGTRAGLSARVSRLAIGLGCAVAHARDIVHADGLALDDANLVTPIGVSCRVCERVDCHDRALPSVHHRLEVDENRRGLSLYARPG